MTSTVYHSKRMTFEMQTLKGKGTCCSGESLNSKLVKEQKLTATLGLSGCETRWWSRSSPLAGQYCNCCPGAKHQREAVIRNHSEAGDLPLGLTTARCEPKTSLFWAASTAFETHNDPAPQTAAQAWPLLPLPTVRAWGL